MSIELKSPQQQIYDAVFLVSLNLGYATYDYLPANEVAYPFVYVGEQFDQDIPTKTAIHGQVQQTIHIYHTHRKRRELTTMINNLRTELRKIKRTENFDVTVAGISSRTLPEEKLLHGVLEVEFKFN